MKTIFFAAALHVVNAVKMHQNMNQYHALDLAQISDQQASNSLAEGASFTATDANCEVVENGIVVRSSTPECQLVKKPAAPATAAETVSTSAAQSASDSAGEADAGKPTFKVHPDCESSANPRRCTENSYPEMNPWYKNKTYFDRH